MITKYCNLCKETKTISEFNKKGKSFQANCRACQKIKKDQHYVNNKAVYVAKARKYDDAKKRKDLKKVIDYFKLHPCVDCGETDPLVLEFDHIDVDTKDNDVCSMICQDKVHWHIIEKEISKCEVRCANCHRRKTAKQCNSIKYQLMLE